MNVRKTSQGYIVDGRPMSAERFRNMYPDYVEPQAEVADEATGAPAVRVDPVSGFRALVAGYRARNMEAEKVTTAGGTVQAATFEEPVTSREETTEDGAEVLVEVFTGADIAPMSEADVEATGSAPEIDAGAADAAPSVAAAAAPSPIAQAKAKREALKAARKTEAAAEKAVLTGRSGIAQMEAEAAKALAAEIAIADSTPVVSRITPEMIAAADAAVAAKEAAEAKK